MARQLIYHLWNRSWGTSTRKDAWLWDNGDGTYTIEWRANAYRNTGERAFDDLEAAQRALVAWTRVGGWKDLNHHGETT